MSRLNMKGKRRFQLTIRIGVDNKEQLAETLKMIASKPGKLPLSGVASTGALVDFDIKADAAEADIREIMPSSKGWGVA